MDVIDKNRWHFMIRLPKDKLTNFAKRLRQERDNRIMLREQPFYRERQQSFYWVNGETYGYDYQLKINLIACFEEYEVVNPETAKIEKQFSEHAWISSLPPSVDNVHTLTNLGARKAWLIEHSFNVEKNQGYHYKHAFSYEWHAMQGQGKRIKIWQFLCRLMLVFKPLTLQIEHITLLFKTDSVVIKHVRCTN